MKLITVLAAAVTAIACAFGTIGTVAHATGGTSVAPKKLVLQRQDLPHNLILVE